MQVGVGKGRYSRLSPCLISSVHPSLPVHPLVYTSKCTIELVFERLSSERECTNILLSLDKHTDMKTFLPFYKHKTGLIGT